MDQLFQLNEGAPLGAGDSYSDSQKSMSKNGASGHPLVHPSIHSFTHLLIQLCLARNTCRAGVCGSPPLGCKLHDLRLWALWWRTTSSWAGQESELGETAARSRFPEAQVFSSVNPDSFFCSGILAVQGSLDRLGVCLHPSWKSPWVGLHPTGCVSP